MVERSDLEMCVRTLVAYDIVSKPLSSLGQKADRRKDNLAGEVATLLKEDEEFKRVTAYTQRIDEEKARTLREGINDFKEKYSKYGKVLEGMIQEKRIKKNKYLCYGINEGFNLGAEDYRRVMRNVGLTTEQADAMYPHLKTMSDKLGKAKEQSLRKILLK